MTLEEIGKLRLEIEAASAKESLDDLQKISKNINSELRLMELNGEKGSEGWKQLKVAQKEVNAEIKEMAKSIDVNDATMKELQASSKLLHRELANLKIGSEEWIAKLKEVQEVDEKLAETKKQVKGVNDEADKGKGMWDTFKVSFAGAFTGAAILEGITAAAGAVVDFGKEVFQTTATFEKYEAVLGNALGSHEAAEKAMNQIKTLAIQTPFAVDELTDSYIKYVNRGLQPSMAEMTKLGDIAASQGKSFDQLTEAVLDAGTGEFERLKEFGIQASKSNGEVELSFKGVTKTVKDTPEAINEALMSFGEMEGVAGSMAVQMNTLGGRVSNLEDSYDALKLAIGERFKPVFTAVLDLMDKFLGYAGDMVEHSGPLMVAFEGIAQVVSMILNAGMDLIQIFFPGLNAQSLSAGNVMRTLGLVMAGIVEILKGLVGVVRLAVDIVNVLVQSIVALDKAMSGDFKGAAAAFNNSITQLANNAKKSWNDIGTTFNSSVTQAMLSGIKEQESGHLKSLDTRYKAQKEAINKNVKDEKDRAAQLTALEKKHNDDAFNFKRDSLNKQANAEIAHIKKSVADEGERAKQIKAVAEKLKTDVGKLRDSGLDEGEKKHKASQDKQTDAEKKAIDQREKANKDALKRLDDARVAAIKNDVDRALAAEDLKHKRELQRIDESKANNALKNQEIQAEESRHEAAMAKIRDDARKKEEQLSERWLETEFTRKIKKAQAFANAEIAEAQRVVQDKEKQAAIIKKIEDNLQVEIQSIRDDAKAKEDKDRSEKLKKEADARDKKLKAEKVAFDAQFQIEVEAAKLSLELTTTNSQAQFDAKLRLMKLEMEEKKKKLEWEAQAEKNRIRESITDNDERAKAEKSIDDRLKNSLALADAKFQNDKTQLQDQANSARQKNNQEFFDNLNKLGQGDYQSFFSFINNKIRDEKTHLATRNADHVSFGSAMKGLMTGDFSTFSTFLAQKTKADSVFNSERFQAFAKASENIGQVAQQAIGKLQEMNQKYLDSQLKKIEKEKTEQLNSWKKQYDSGKISKEQYEKGIEKINTDYKERELAEKKKAFERDKKLQMANALVAGALAFVKALASSFFPVNLVMAATTAVATGLQVASIARQKFEARKGYLSNGGVPSGPRHGMKYGDSGIALVDRSTQQEIGEMEGGEPFMILSRETYKNNGPIIDRLLHSSMHQNGKPISLRRGGVMGVRESDYFEKGMYLFGSKKKKREAERAAAEATAEAERMQAEAEAESAAAMAGIDTEYGGDMDMDMSATNAQIEQSTQLQQDIADATAETVAKLDEVIAKLSTMIGQNDYANNMLGVIASKPAISVHDLYGAMDRVAAVAAKSNL